MSGADGNDMEALAELSHAIERLAFAFVRQNLRADLAVPQLVELAAGDRAAAAMALSYALRTAEREDGPEPEEAVTMLRLALSPRFWRTGGQPRR
ncbi:MAG: hypothetical protein ACR2H3_14920 [Acidimicrobiales bacterium]